MSAKNQNVFQSLWRQSQVALPLMHPAEQTKLSLARLILAYEDVPDCFKGFFTPFLSNGQTFPYCVLTPTFEGFLSRATEKLICDLGHAICILTRNGNGFEAQSFPLAGVSYVEIKTSLLDSRITISGMSSQGNLVTTTFRFNSVGDYLFTPFLERIRYLAVGEKEAVQLSEMDKFNQWSNLNFKFMNYARRSLLGREKVVEAILQPEILAARFSVLGKTFYKTISPTHATILTDRELILIREEHLQSGGGRYGGAWVYIALDKISALRLDEKESNLLALSIHLPENERLEFLFQVSARNEIEQMLQRFKELTGRI